MDPSRSYDGGQKDAAESGQCGRFDRIPHSAQYITADDEADYLEPVSRLCKRIQF